jgi:hypothetical protein
MKSYIRFSIIYTIVVHFAIINDIGYIDKDIILVNNLLTSLYVIFIINAPFIQNSSNHKSL